MLKKKLKNSAKFTLMFKKNVEYSSGRNKTFLCYVVETQGKESGTFRGYLEDEHAAAHVEDAFFNNILPTCDPNLRYNVTWYVSSSPCVPCAGRIAQILQKNKNLRLSILVSRLFMWEEPEMQNVNVKLLQLQLIGKDLRRSSSPASRTHGRTTYYIDHP
uniref:Apolipoprotein B mRNA editing enzyme catalytic subunit 2 n=1 Tax=Chelonoidis abingdonii TaxID=106734 RepID=A0A8C0GU29_CHEAB